MLMRASANRRRAASRTISSYEWALAIDAWARTKGYSGVHPDEGLEDS
jgi:hypothetical protein